MDGAYFKDDLVRRYAQGRIVAVIKDMSSANVYTPKQNYLIVEAFEREGNDAICAALELQGFRELEDYLCPQKYSLGLPIDFEFRGIPIGKYTYINFDPWFADNYVSSVGRHTSINDTARIERDHPLNMITMNHNSLFNQVFSDADREYAQTLAAQGRKNPSNKVKIGNDVWIGANAFINCSRVTEIGDGAIIGTGAVVLENVPPYAIVVGVPAKVKKYRYTPEQIEVLLRVKWWDWDDETLRKNARLLMHPELFFAEFA